MLKKIVSGIMLTLLLIGMLMLAFNIQSVKTEPATIIVPDDYSTIQEAINNAFNGDTIYVKAGTYYENVVVNKTILLIGESKENTIIDGKGIGKVLELMGDGILISNFTITNGEMGIYITNSHRHMIRNNIFIKNNVGVFMDRGYCNMIQKNNFTSNSYGVYLTFNESLTYIGWSFDNQIVKNYFSNNTYGIYSNIGAATFINSQFNTTISENELKNNLYGIFLYLSPVNRILENTISLNDYGIHIELSSGNYLINNSITENAVSGITLHLASDNSLISNNISKCDIGITLSLSSSNLICRNVIANNNIGVKTELSDDNTIYNNDFVRNDQQVTTDGLSSNKWNATYPYGGNYWSDYVGADIYRGPYQNETGSDGIGDTPYIVDINELFDTYNIDYYPLMKPCIVKCYVLTIISGVGGTTEPSPGTYTYTAGTELNVTAIPNAGFSFDHWLLDANVRTENPITVVMNENHTLEAYFIDDIPPVTTDDYDGLWHNTDFTITLTATDHGSGVAETYYRINDGSVKAVSVDGQPVITTESANNTLEYWSVDYAGNEEPHKFLTGIKLDKTSPLITSHFRFPDDNVEPNEIVKVTVNVTDFLSDVKNCTVSYRIAGESTWINIPMTLNQTTMLYEAFIQIQEPNVEVEYRIIAYDNAGNVALEDNNGQYYTYTVIPEFPSITTLLLMLIVISIIVSVKREVLRRKFPHNFHFLYTVTHAQQTITYRR